MFVLSLRALGAGLALSCLGLSFAAAANLKGQIHLDPTVEAYRLLVKFRASEAPDALKGPNGTGLSKTLGLRFVPALDPVANGLAKGAADPVLAAFAGLMYLESPGASPLELKALGEKLEALDAVEYAMLEPVRGPPPPVAADIAPATPSYVARQGWQGPAPAGVDCQYAWTRGAKGRGVRLHDIEDSWGALDHEDFETDSLAYARPAYNSTYDDHGIAVFGATFARHNGYGVNGCAPEATGRAWSFQNANGSQSRAATLVLMGAAAKPGDVILLEMQAGGLGGDNLAPADVETAVWDATRAATDKGVVVIGTAGNGQADLDGAAYADYRARGDNGVIMTGGGNASTRARYVGSFGACCVHVQGWGHNVTTTGYSDLFRPNGDARQSYTQQFSGTSSAGAMVAALAVSLQSHALAALKRPLAPREMRAILIATGTPQSGTARIGPLPDLRRAILRVDSLAGVVVPPDTSVDTNVVALRAAGRPAARLKALAVRGGALEADVRAAAPFTLALLDASGREAARTRFAAGEGRARLETPGLAPGLYTLVLSEGTVRQARRVALP